MALRDWLSCPVATATPATPATHGGGLGGTVATVATVAVARSPELSREALLALVEKVAARYRAPPDDLAEMKRIALRDPRAAWRCFLETARTEGIQ